MKEIQLTLGKVALVDDEDVLLVSQFKWHAQKGRHTFYAVTDVRKEDGKWKAVKMHRLFLPDSKQVDHRDGNGLNNQRFNMRPATRSQNAANSRKPASGVTSQYRGVSFHKSSKKFAAQIETKNKNKHLGLFISEVDAARAYDDAALQHFGEFARLNFPQQKEAA